MDYNDIIRAAYCNEICEQIAKDYNAIGAFATNDGNGNVDVYMRDGRFIEFVFGARWGDGPIGQWRIADSAVNAVVNVDGNDVIRRRTIKEMAKYVEGAVINDTFGVIA